MEYRELLRTKIASLLYVPEELITICVSEHDSTILDGQATMIVRSIQEIWYESLEDIVYPVDWWQAFKDRWFPAWAKKRWPVKYKRYCLAAAYPEYVPLPTERVGGMSKIKILTGIIMS